MLLFSVINWDTGELNCQDKYIYAHFSYQEEGVLKEQEPEILQEVYVYIYIYSLKPHYFGWNTARLGIKYSFLENKFNRNPTMFSSPSTEASKRPSRIIEMNIQETGLQYIIPCFTCQQNLPPTYRLFLSKY